jgi:hypothetical protein
MVEYMKFEYLDSPQTRRIASRAAWSRGTSEIVRSLAPSLGRVLIVNPPDKFSETRMVSLSQR